MSEPRPRLQLQRAEDRARLQGPRPRAGGDRARGAPTSPPPTSGRSSISSSPSSSAPRDAATGRRSRSGGGVAANAELRERTAGALRRAGPAAQARPDRALHRQRGDDRLRRPLHRADPVSRLPGLRCLRRLVTLYARPDCHLCDEARAGLEATARRRRSTSSSRRWTSRPTTSCMRRYLERIPVVELDGEIVSELWPRRGDGLAGAGSIPCPHDRGRGGRDRRAAEASDLTDGDRLSLGVAARLSRYLQVLTQARKMGKDTISSQELSDYTHINSTQIRRDLSGFGKFGKRGVGYNVDSLVQRDPEDPADRGPAQHRAVRRRPPRPGDRQLGHLRRPRLPDRRDVRRRSRR